MRRRKLRWVMTGLVVLLLTSSVIALWPRTDRITEENCDRIQSRMSRANVETILGKPGDFRTRLTKTADPWPFRHWVVGIVRIVREPERWEDNNGTIYVMYDESGNVTDRTFIPAEDVPQPPLENLLWRSKRQWRQWFPE